VIALAVTRDGMPVRSWVLPGDTADVATVARIKEDLRTWRLGRCVLVGDAGLYSADNLGELARGLGRYILAVPMRRLKEVEAEVLARPGRYRKVAPNLEVKEVWVGKGERRRRYVVCFNPEEAERQRQHDPNAIDVVRFTVSVPFVGAGPARRRRRRDARFPRA
jgi:transposase